MCGRYTLSTVDGPDDRPALRPARRRPTRRRSGASTSARPRRSPWSCSRPRPRAVRVGAAAVPRPEVRADQRALGDGRAALQVADDRRALPGPGRRLVRVAEGGEARARRACRSATRSTAACRSRSPGLYDGTGAAILTTAANEICAPVHDRMPCVLAGPEAEAAWLSEDVASRGARVLSPLEQRADRRSRPPTRPSTRRGRRRGAANTAPSGLSAALRLALLKGSASGRRDHRARRSVTAGRGLGASLLAGRLRLPGLVLVLGARHG